MYYKFDVVIVGAGGAGLGVRAGTNLVWVGGFNAADSFSGVGTQMIIASTSLMRR